MGRAPCCDKANVKRGPWSPEEDAKLKGYIEEYGTGGNWIALPQKIGLKRCGKSCRLRWLNYLRPNIKHGGFSEEEESIICSLYMTIGSRWSIIAAQLPGRTDNDIKNYWNTRLKKKLIAKQRKEAAAAVSRLQINNQSQLNHDQVPSYDLPVVHAADSDHMTVSQQEHPHLANQMLEFDQYLRFLSTQDHPLSKNCINFHHDCPPSSSTSSSIPQLIQQDQYHMDSLLNATMNSSSNIYTQDMQYYFDSGTNISGGGYPEMAPQGGGTINLPLYDQHLLYHDAAAASLYNDNYLLGLLDGVVAEGLNSGNASSSTTTSASVEETTASLGPDMSPMLYQPPGISSLDDVCQQTRMLQLQQGGFIMESAEYSSSNVVV